MESSSNHYLEGLQVKNFTAFERSTLGFVSGVNAIVGENGTGKTHLLKLAFSFLHASAKSNKSNGLSNQEIVNQIFQLEKGLRPLVRRNFYGATGECEIAFNLSGKEFLWGFRDENAFNILSNIWEGQISIPVFIPAIDMLGHTKGFVSTYDNYAIDFDLTHREIVSLLLSPEKRELDEWAQNLVDQLSKPLGGRVELRGERFYVVNDSSELSVTSVGEGLRKIATLIRLIQTGWLAPGTTLFWDEPETNLNPKLMDEVVEAILALSRAGVQVILATHSYIILKELDLRLGTDEARFFSLEPTDSGTKVHSFSNFTELKPNAILDQYASIYERQLSDLTEG